MNVNALVFQVHESQVGLQGSVKHAGNGRKKNLLLYCIADLFNTFILWIA